MLKASKLARSFSPLKKNLSSLSQLKPDQTFSHDWQVVKSTSIPELNLTNAVHLKHKHCNAQWLHMENLSDETNAFSIHFKTVPRDSTGIAHILEHCALCGSQKFPVRDPFMKMLNRSLATMNAMTGPDYTFYPFATPNSKDFYNMMQVYLDACFSPLLREMDFKQEGWRLDMDKEKGDLAIKGVVFNEMKGAFADAQQVFGQKLLNAILPSDTYGICSGGLPEIIPQLTWDDLRQFHAVHYSPNNARFYSYGNLPLEQHLEAVQDYLPPQRQNVNMKDVAPVPSEPRWTQPRREHISCPEDPSGSSNTIAVSYLLNPIEDHYENFVLRVIGDLMVDGPSAPFYKKLIESGLGSAFSPVTGYDAHTKDTGFTVGLQGIDMAKADEIEKVILETLEEIAENGFENDRVTAILNRTELSLKKLKDEFGWKLIMSLTSGWNHVHDPLALLSINPILDKFKEDLKDDTFLTKKVQQHFVENKHRFTLTMSPQNDYLENQQKQLKDLEDELVSKLSAEERQKAIEQGKELERMQSSKDSEETLSCLPTLTLSDIPLSLPSYGGISQAVLHNKIQGQLSTQATNEVAYTRLLLNTDNLTNEEKKILPLFSMVMTSLGAGSLSYRDLDLQMDLHTGGMSSSLHLSEDPQDSQRLIQNGLLLSSVCLERNFTQMLDLWGQIFHGLLVPDNSIVETSQEGLQTRLSDLISMSAVSAKNGLAYGGHHYAMAHAASKLKDFPALALREEQSGLTMVRLLNSLKDKDDQIEELIQKMSILARKLLNASNISTFMTSAQQNSDIIQGKLEDFVRQLPAENDPQVINSSTTKEPSSQEKSQNNTYIVSPFLVHFNSAVLRGAPSYTHEDAAPLRVLSRLLSSKFLHVEIREKGGAYGGGCSASPTSGTLTFYSYRDPNFERTLDAFQQCNDWIQKDSFADRDVDEAKLSVFKALDKPVLPGSRGLRLFLSGITDAQFEAHRNQLRNVSYEDVKRVSQKYLGDEKEKFITTLGPEPKKAENFKIEPLLEN